MMVSFLAALLTGDQSQNEKMGDAAKINIFKSLLNTLAGNINLKFIDGTIGTGPWKEYLASDIEELVKNLATVIYYCLALGLGKAPRRIMEKLTAHLAEHSKYVFDEFYMPLVKNLITKFKEKGLSVKFDPLQHMVYHILSGYSVRFVGVRPDQFKDWTRLPVTCLCDVCKPLNDFLMNPLEETLTFVSPPVSGDVSMGAWNSDWGFSRDVEDKTSVTITKHAETDLFDWTWKSSYDSTKKYLERLDWDILMNILSPAQYLPLSSMSANDITIGLKKAAIGSQIVASKQKEDETNFKRKHQHNTPLH